MKCYFDRAVSRSIIEAQGGREKKGGGNIHCIPSLNEREKGGKKKRESVE